MSTEQELLQKLEQQIALINQFVLNLQQDQHWQHLFYKNKLYLSLNLVFEKTHTEYIKYLDDIIADFKKIKVDLNLDIKKYYIAKVENKIFVLLKILRNLKKFDTPKFNLEERIIRKQQKVQKFLNQQSSLEKRLEYLNKQYIMLNKQLIYGSADLELQKKLLGLLEKRANLEKELFSVKQMVNLLS